MSSMMRWTSSLMLALMIAGCGSQTRKYDVSVENRTDRTITLWLTKDGPPAEEGWYSPEELRERGRGGEAKYDMAIVPPKRTGETGEVKGKFNSGTNAVLRVYEGAPELADLVGETARPRERVDHILTPGRNALAVVDRDGKLVVIKE